MNELEPEARQILDAVRAARTPSAADRERNRRRLATALGASAGLAVLAHNVQASASTGATTSATTSATTGATAGATTSTVMGTGKAKLAAGWASKLWIKAVLSSSVVAGVSLGSYVAVHDTQLPKKTTSPVVVESRPEKPEPTETAATAATPVLPEPATAVPSTQEQARKTGPARADRPHRRRPARHAAQIEPQAPAPTASLAAELQLLQQAQETWRRHQPQQAKRLLDRHRTRYPASPLQLERDSLRVLILCELGHTEAATRLAQRLLTEAPDSPLRGTIEESCALK